MQMITTKIFNNFSAPIKEKYFSLLLMFNLISGGAYCSIFNDSFFVIFSILTIAFAVAYLESVFLLPFIKYVGEFY